MSELDVGRLTPADEGLNHQIADTFATVVESERSWTEKIWGSIARKDGGLQIDFGLGKYINRNVLDAFGGVSRGREQWTVRASRILDPDHAHTGAGPLRYEVLEPLKRVRFQLEPNPTQPIAFDITFSGILPPFFEKRNRLRTGNRIRTDTVRYHQSGDVTGWVEVQGARVEMSKDWFGVRDHSWGMRGDNVGFLPSDIPSPTAAAGGRMRLLWGVWALTRPDGACYDVAIFFWSTGHWDYYSGHINEADGTQHEIVRMTPEVKLDPQTRAFISARYTLLMASGETRHMDVEGVGDSGFYLRTGLYGEWAGKRPGSWPGGPQQDGEYIADCVAKLRDLGHMRDKPVRVLEGDAEGW